MHSSTATRGLVLCLVPPLIWGGMFPIANDLAPTVNAFHMTLIRYVTAAALLAVMLWRAEGLRALSFDGRVGRLFVLGTAGFAGFGLLAFTALRYTSAPNVSLIMAMMPAIGAVVGAIATRKLPAGYTVASILVAFAGVSLVISDGDYGRLFTGQLGLGELLALLGAICWVTYTRGAAGFPGWSALRYTTLTTVMGCVSIFAAVLIATGVGYVAQPELEAVLGGWLHLAYLIIFAAVVAVLSWNKGIGLLGPLNGTLFMNLVPVVTFAIAMIRGYQPSVTALLGAGLVIAALLVNNLFSRRSGDAVRGLKLSVTRPGSGRSER
ncbi:DMT family transporter [Paenarthrobacter sp. NPDC090520]|uniref:DMT family transporter n=1 Tax=unclassified Paenarthrobacter TaxID=2634190 RepID=UPI00381949A3